jgi:hypothetical protein
MRTQPDSIIRDLENHNSRLDKEAILAAAAKEGLDEFFDGLKLALDSMITFGVKQVPVKEEIWIEGQEVNGQISKKLEPNGQGLAWSVFVDLAEKLRTRELTGHDARDAIELAMSVATTQQWNDWYRRILIKDLRCGVSVKTVNKVCKDYPQYSVPVYTCMLAHDSAKHEKKMKGRKQIEIKLDGCLSDEWLIEFENGQKISIKKVVDNKLKGKIKSYNTITGKVEFNEILNWVVDGQDDNEDSYEWFEIELENGITLPPLTGNHLVYLPKLKCYRRADLLIDGDEVLLDI